MQATGRQRRRGSPWAVWTVAAFALSAVVMQALVSASAARAATTTFTYTGGEQTYSVPAGATAVTISAVGAPGGDGANSTGGNGATVTATVQLPTGTSTLYVEVGGAGISQNSCQQFGVAAFNGGGATACGGGGGGASDVRLDPAATPLTTTDSRLVVAGGGGGGATGDLCGGAGGAAGDTAASGAGGGGNGNDTNGPPPDCAGAAGSDGGFGAPGGAAGLGTSEYPNDGGSGELGVGGAAGFQGASGGGGYWGGGGGGGGYVGGGGGAGSSYWITGATSTSMSEDATGTAEVQITPVFPCTPTGFYRDGIDLTAAQIGGNITGTLDATGCNIGVYYGPGTSGMVSGANISGANYYGVVNNAASVNVSNSSIYDIGETQPNGSQHGVGVIYTTLNGTASCNACVTSGPHASGTLSGNTITNYQKNGVVISGTGAAATVQSNTVTGYGMINYIAQNGIEVASAATASIKGNTVSGNWYTPKAYVGCGLLFYQAGGVKQQGNNLFNNEVNLCNAGRGGGNYNP